MQKSITALLALALASAGLLALAQGDSQSDLQVKETAPDRYVVQRGDTLWSIATKLLSDQWRWPAIWRMNQAPLKNPHNISPGDVLVLDRTVGPPQLRSSDAGGAGGADGGGPGAAGVGGGELQPRIYAPPCRRRRHPPICRRRSSRS